MPIKKAKKTRKTSARLEFNHAMIYTRDVSRALRFYRDALGFKLIEEYMGASAPVYARLQSPAGKMTIALHLAGPGQEVAASGTRLYFEVKDVEGFCEKLQGQGITITQGPKLMPWGWKHAYLDDPDGHEVSIYWAGAKRFRKTDPRGMQRSAAK